MIMTRHIRAVACSVAAIAVTVPVAAIAQAQTYSFNIPAQDLASALRQFAQTSRQQVSFNGAAVRGRRSVPLLGAHSVDGGLSILLRGTGLSVRRAGRVLVIQKNEPAMSAVSTQPAVSRAQDDAAGVQESAESGDAEIVVSGSRIDRPGFESPTPLTRVSAEELGVGSRANVGAALADLPQFKAGQSPQTSGTNAQAGRMPVDLRGLGAARTLVLIDGRRFTSDNDLSTVPSILVKNVDIVTGGASAAWGSGAVAGVVNILLNHDLKGLRLGAEAGISTYGDAGQRRLEAAFGTDFDGGRGHFMIGGEYLENDGLMTKVARPNTGRWVLLTQNGVSTLTPNVGYANAVIGGIILSGVNANKGFNPDGTLRNLVRGTVVGANMIGGEAPSDDDYSPLATPQTRVAGLVNVSYELFDDAKLTIEGRYSRYWGNYTWFGDHNRGGITIQRDNAFLRPEIRQQMLLAGQTSFTMGRFNSDLSYTTIDLEREAFQTTVALDGSFDEGRWRYGVYFSHGQYQNNIDTPGFRKTVEFANAIDAVVGPAGTPVCRIALTNPTTNCVPLNLFGNGAPSAAAIAYVTGTPSLRSTTRLHTFGADLRGEPFELPAGPVSIAVGVEGRWESINSVAGALDRARVFTTFQFGDLAGKDSVKEAFGEIVIPVLKDVPFFNKLELNGAARYSDYRNSGGIWSWKLGATNEFLPGVVGRVTRSRDIRAPSLSDLYTTRTQSYVGVVDVNPVTGVSQSVTALIIGGGNANLLPEAADTWTAGITTSPLRGLTASLDYFDITINGVIASVGAQDVINRCRAGNQDLCGRISRDAGGNLIEVRAVPANLQQYKTNGVDGEIAYTTSLGGDPTKKLNFRLVGTWVNSLTINDGITNVEYVKNTSYAFVTGMPDWRINGSVGYSDDGFNAVVRARYIGPGYYNRNQAITNNRVPAYTYVDLQLSKTIAAGGREFDIYANVSNLFDKDPPIASLFSPFYDTVGRFVTVGARVRL
ncbi:TonB-dependent receptor plug domain-containing protein [Sphingomonas sp. MG17]|uniref:TonB-dependent receptor plug domain-containing protein n=1 Tax=Sphingomonas tagetis TaxID=2949092 RepID=A0A9X2HRB8_9SPHN|nr:TonB-dependent receptor [Sphingomonas tagetis]MCP3732981.1 TonB-dependent receptor plug domain-containing protein [Sphingomonas tagetis]